MIEQKNAPDFTCSAYTEMSPAWNFLSDVLAGQDTIKAKKETYLPKEDAEHPTDYDNRLKRSLLFEDTRDCAVNLTGIAFRKLPTLGEDVPDLIREFAKNIDNAGTHLDVFLQHLFQEALSYGHAFLVVERPPRSENIRTAADEIASGARSYWCMRQAKDALNWRTTVINGKTVLSQITFKECTTEADGEFGEKKVTRYRVYRLDQQRHAQWQLWEEKETANPKGEKTVEKIGEGQILTKRGEPLKRLPVAVVYGEQTGALESRPPLKGIADINLAFYQKYSDLTNIEHFACAVTLCITGTDPQDTTNRTLGGNAVLALGVGQDAKFLTVEGKSIEHLEKDLEMLEKRLCAKGLDFLQDEHYVPPTATEVVLSYTQRTSKLVRIVRSTKDCVEQGFSITAEIEGLDKAGTITLAIDENSLSLSPEQIRILSEMNEKGQLSLETLWEILDRGDQLPDGFDPLKELARLKKAAEEQMELNAKQFDAGLESTP